MNIMEMTRCRRLRRFGRRWRTRLCMPVRMPVPDWELRRSMPCWAAGCSAARLHEVHAAAEADAVAASGFALGLAARCAGEQPVLWVREENADREMGGLYAPGIAASGL